MNVINSAESHTRSAGLRRNGPILVEQLGVLDYQEARQAQEQHAIRRRDGTGPDVLMLLEHPSVYTAGRRTSPEHLPIDGTPVVEVDRGGQITWHGPGQLVGYPIVALRRPGRVRDYVVALEDALVCVCRQLGVRCSGGVEQGRLGVWLDGPAPPRKIAAIGVRVRGGVTAHGFALNCNPALEPFDRIVPCGIEGASVTSLSDELGRTVQTAELRAAVEREVLAALD